MSVPLISISSSRVGILCLRLLSSNIHDRIRKTFWIMTLSIMAFACQNKSTSFKSFDSTRWIEDYSMCQNYRNAVIEEMKSEFDKFIGMSETEIIVHLGVPTKTHLYTRGQKFFSYHLACKDSTDATQRLRIRFSALDYVNEVLILD